MIKALTISQPFASMIGEEKWIENRCWSTNYRGWLAIHAGKGTQYLTKAELAKFPVGCVIKVARLVACWDKRTIDRKGQEDGERDRFVPGTSKSWAEAAAHPHCEGPFCWFLEDIRKRFGARYSPMNVARQSRPGFPMSCVAFTTIP